MGEGFSKSSALYFLDVIKELKNPRVLANCLILLVDQNEEFAKRHQKEIGECYSLLKDEGLKEKVQLKIGNIVAL